MITIEDLKNRYEEIYKRESLEYAYASLIDDVYALEKQNEKLKIEYDNLLEVHDCTKENNLKLKQQLAESEKKNDINYSIRCSLEQKIADAEKGMDAFEKLLVCYRVGKSPSEKLFKQLEKAREYKSKYKGGEL